MKYLLFFLKILRLILVFPVVAVAVICFSIGCLFAWDNSIVGLLEATKEFLWPEKFDR